MLQRGKSAHRRGWRVLGVRRTPRHCPNGRVAASGLERLEDRQLLAADPVIAELMAINHQSVADADGDHSDWLEIANLGDQPADLSGWYLTDDPDQLTKWELPELTIGASEHRLIFASDKHRTNPDGELHTNFRLDGDGEYLALVEPDGVTIAHDYRPEFPEQQPDVSYGIFGSDRQLGYFSVPTPGRPNRDNGSKAPPQALLINEIMYHPASENDAEEYIELFNAGTETVNLNGWRISDAVELQLPDISLAAGQFLVVAADPLVFEATYGEVTNVAGPWSGRLSNSSETITLRDSFNRVADRVTYADEGDWARRLRGPVDHGSQGWTWSDAHDGAGHSLELTGVHMPNEFGQNWAASTETGGSPGTANGTATPDVAPLIVDLDQNPAIPLASDTVRIEARVVDEGMVSAALHWRVDGTDQFTRLPMSDDGLNGDQLPADGLFYAQLPSQPDRTVVEYYVSATDASGNQRTWPAATVDEGQATNALYQVIDDFDPNKVLQPGAPPVYYQIMTGAERREFTDIERASDAQMNATFVSVRSDGIDVRHNVGVRIRGSGSRRDNPPNNRVNIPTDRPLDGVTAWNFNVDTVHDQIAGSILFRMAGLAAANANGAIMYSNGVNLHGDGLYAQLEPLGTEFAENHFPDDNGGNLYKGRRPNESPPGGQGAGLRYFGPDPEPYVSYTKLTNASAADYSDVIHLTDVLNNAPDETYLEEVAKIVDIDQWLRFFAFNWLISNTEGGLVNGDRQGDDYAMYRGVEDSRFVMVPHDLDSIMSVVNRSNPFRAANVDALRRLLYHESIKPRYYAELLDLIETVFEAEETENRIRSALQHVVGPGQIDNMIAFMSDRADYVRSLIPEGLEFQTSLPIVDDRITTTESRLGLYGTADYRANSVRVNGQVAQFFPRTNFWQLGSFENTIVPFGAEWQYLDDGSDQGTAWRVPDFNPGPAWNRGPAELGFGDGDEETEIGFGDDPDNKHVTTYFRHEFELPDPERYADLVMHLVRDDGIIVYLNGVEVARNNMPPGDVTRDTLATNNITGRNERSRLGFNLDASRLRAGRNVLAVEVHQAFLSSADLSFDFRLRGRYNPADQGAELLPGVNSVLIQAMSGANGDGEVVASETVEVWRRTPRVTEVAGTLPTGTTTWTRAGAPYLVTSDVTVPVDGSLIIEPGVSVYFQQDTELIVSGELTAVGNEVARIRFTSDPTAPPTADLPGLPDGPPRWDGIHFVDSRSDNNKIAYADIHYAQDNDGSIGVLNSSATIDHVTFAGTHLRMIFGNSASLHVSNSRFPDMFAPNENPIELNLDNVAEQIKLVGRTPPDGQLVIEGNWFGTNKGHNDTIDANSNHVERGPILQVRNNVFTGSGDELLDLGGDVYVAGNVFQNVFKDDTSSDRGYASVMSTGDAGTDRTVVVTRNLFYDVDHAINLRQQNASIFEYNTVVKVHPDFEDRFGHPNIGSVVNLFVDEPGATAGKGAYVGRNILSDIPRVFGNADLPAEATSALQLEDNLLHDVSDLSISADRPNSVFDLGTGNTVENPRFVDPSSLDFAVRKGSVARDPASPTIWGAGVPAAIWIDGEPPSPTPFRNATLTVGGPGMFAYRYRVNGGPWSDTLPIGTGFDPNGTVRTARITLSDLADGQYVIEVEGRDFAGNWQAAPSVSKTWTVDAGSGQVLLSELLADNDSAVADVGDLVELHNASASPVNLQGLQLSDDRNELDKFVFAEETMIPAGGYLTLLADSETGPGIHLGFSLDADGEAVYLSDASGQILDSVQFGMQVTDVAIGRVGNDRQWQATEFTVNRSNHPARLGDTRELFINEWLASDSEEPDFIELYNGDSLPIALGGLFLSDAGDGAPDRHEIAPLSFIGPRDFQAFVADSQPDRGPDHLDFRLSIHQETLRLSSPELEEIDTIVYTPQTRGWSEGRSPDGGGNIQFYELPSPGWVNGGGTLGDIDFNGRFDVRDIDLLCNAIRLNESQSRFDLNRDGSVGLLDQRYLVTEIIGTTFGDANLDGTFDSRDLVEIFQAGQYEDNQPGNSSWASGDWNCDTEFDTRDMVLAFQTGAYVNQASLPARWLRAAAHQDEALKQLAAEPAEGNEVGIDLTLVAAVEEASRRNRSNWPWESRSRRGLSW